MHATLPTATGGVLGAAERLLFGGCDRAEQFLGGLTEHAEAAARYFRDPVAYARTQDSAAHALRQITGPAKRNPPALAEWMHQWAAAQRKLAKLHAVARPKDREVGRDGFTTVQVLGHAADVADALADALHAAYCRTLHLDGDQRLLAPRHIERIAGARLDAPEDLYNSDVNGAFALKQLIADLYPVCGRGANALALLLDHPIAA